MGRVVPKACHRPPACHHGAVPTTDQPTLPRTRRGDLWVWVTVATLPAALITNIVLAHTRGRQILDALLPDGLSSGAATILGAGFYALPVIAAVTLGITAHDGGRRPWARAAAPVLVWWLATVPFLVMAGPGAHDRQIETIYGDLAPTVDALGTGLLLVVASVVGAALVAGIAVTLAFRAPADLATWSPEATRARGRRYLRTLGWVFLAVFVAGVVVAVAVIA